jgi:kynurenine formamidase
MSEQHGRKDTAMIHETSVTFHSAGVPLAAACCGTCRRFSSVTAVAVGSWLTVKEQMAQRQNGRIPPKAFVAMYSNWAARWPTAAYLNEDDTGTYNFPGFGGDATQFLVEEREIIGIGCDSHSLDARDGARHPLGWSGVYLGR